MEIVEAYAFLLDTLRDFFRMRGYTEVRLPAIHAGKNEGDIFELDYFGHTARLTSSNALYLDIYTVQLQKAFSIQKCFRAEKSHTNRHLAEFDMLEAEEQLGWYLDMIPYSDFLLSGFGLGIERLAMWLMGLENIRKVHPVFRDTGFSELKKQ